MGCKSSTLVTDKNGNKNRAPNKYSNNNNNNNSANMNSKKLKKFKKGQAKSRNYSEMLYAAVVIQKWIRRWLAYHRLRYMCSWQVFQSLEYEEEGKDTILYNLYADLIQFYREGNRLKTTAISSPRDIPSLESTEDQIFFVPKTYKGPHVTLPITKNQIESVMDAFQNNQIMHAKYVVSLLQKVRQQLSTLPNVNIISLMNHQRLIICGDVHGSLPNLLHILNKNGLPCRGLLYLFNGDFVDRGVSGVEVLLMLSLFLLYEPNCVFLNRGNHEDFVINVKYGFQKEVQRKYKHHADTIIDLVNDLFSWLPLASVVNNKIFVCHAGISNKVTYEKLLAVERYKFQTLLKLPDGSWSSSLIEQWELLCDLLWSDPMPGPGLQHNTKRGFGVLYGCDVTTSFLAENKWDCLIRSHECIPNGFAYEHDKKTITVFSVSSYYSAYSNKGAFIMVWPDSQLKPYQFIVISNKLLLQKQYSFRKQVNSIEMAATRDLKTKILKKQDNLKKRFLSVETAPGQVKLTEWVNVMNEELMTGLPWATLAPLLADVTENGCIHYEKMFQDYNPRSSTKHKDQLIAEELGGLYENEDVLEQIFRDMDQDGSGSISQHEFHEACSRLCTVPEKQEVMKERIDLFVKLLDRNHDGHINFNEFLEAYRIVSNSSNVKSTP